MVEFIELEERGKKGERERGRREKGENLSCIYICLISELKIQFNLFVRYFRI